MRSRITKTLALSGALAALAAPAASAMQLPADPPGWSSSSQAADLGPAGSGGGFNYGDAAIGAGATAVAMAAAGGGLIALRRTRTVNASPAARA